MPLLGARYFFLHKAACKRTQQLPTLLRQQCWELLRACWQLSANERINSQHCWRNNVGSCCVRVGSCRQCCVRLHGALDSQASRNNFMRRVALACFSLIMKTMFLQHSLT